EVVVDHRQLRHADHLSQPAAVGLPVGSGGLVRTLAVGQAMPGHRQGALVGLVAETQGPLADHRLFGVVVVVKGCRRATCFCRDVGDGRRQDAFACVDRSGGNVDRGLCAPAAVRREINWPAGPAIGSCRGRHLVYLPWSEPWSESESDVRFRFGSWPGPAPPVTDGSRKMIKPHNTNMEFELGGDNTLGPVGLGMAAPG